jgi:arabinose-5-phosphate isomerase
VADVMHQGEDVAWVLAETPLRQVIIAMTEHPLGAACVVAEDFKLLGLVTDGDLRRALLTNDDIRQLRATDCMTRKPLTISPDASLREAVRLMEDRPSQISVLPVLDLKTGRCLGLVRIHDIYQPDLV